MANVRPQAIIDLFAHSGIELQDHHASQFFDFYRLLVEHNESRDLTRITGFEEIVVKHFIDCVYVTRIAELPRSLLDIGSGAGFPGIPLKIISPETLVILAEHRPRRVEFMKLVIRELGLQGIEIHPHLVTDKSFFTVNGIITRALESIPETLGRVRHFLPLDGTAMFMKGPSVDDELRNDSGALTPDFIIEKDECYRLPGTTYDRRLLTFRKLSSRMEKTYRIMRRDTHQQGIAITSPDNGKFKELKKIITPDGMKKTGKVVVAGKKIISEMLREKRNVSCLVVHDGYAETDPFLLTQLESNAESGNLLILKKSLFNDIDPAGTGGPLIVTDLPALTDWEHCDIDGCVLAIAFQDPVNVGAVIRSALGLGVSSMIVLKEAASPFHTRAIRSSAGTVFKARLFRGPSMFEINEAAEGRGIPIVALDKTGTPIDEYRFPDRFILLPGLEGPGMPEKLKVHAVAIPMNGNVESLNGPVAAAIAMYRWRESL